MDLHLKVRGQIDVFEVFVRGGISLSIWLGILYDRIHLKMVILNLM